MCIWKQNYYGKVYYVHYAIYSVLSKFLYLCEKSTSFECEKFLLVRENVFIGERKRTILMRKNGLNLFEKMYDICYRGRIEFI